MPEPTKRLMDGVWDLRFTPEIPDDDAFGHGSDFWEDCYRQFTYSTDEYPDQAERVGDTDRIAIGVVHQDGNTVHGRDWDGRAVILELRVPDVAVMQLDQDTFDHVLAMTNKLGGTNVKPGPLPDYVLRAMRREDS